MGTRTPQQEAANYRRRLRDTEQQRDELVRELTTVRAQLVRSEAERFTATLITDDGSINIAKLRRELARHLIDTMTTVDTPTSIR